MPAHHAIQPRKRPRQGRSQATVEAILQATAHILVREGYPGLSTNRVADKAGVSIGSLYQYFPNKQALITAVRQRHADQMQDMLVQLMAQASDSSTAPALHEMVPRMIAAVMAAHRLDPELHQVLEQQVPRQTQQAHATPWEAQLRLLLKTVLDRYADDIQVTRLDLACLVIVRTVDALIHAALDEEAMGVSSEAIEHEISAVVLRYLCRTTGA